MTGAIRIALVGHEANLVRFVRQLEEGDTLDVVGHGPVGRATAVIVSCNADALILELDSGTAAVDDIVRARAARGIPVIALSATMDPHIVARARNAGALDVLQMPPDGDVAAMDALRRRIRTLSQVAVVRPMTMRGAHRPAQPIVGVASSTGGPEALASFLSGLSGLRAPILVVQHIHKDFVERFAGWMADESHLEVKLAEAGELPRAGVVYVAPAGHHLLLTAGLTLTLNEQPQMVHRPSADIMLSSVAEIAGPRGIGVVLTGMGDDGARGLLALRRRGGMTIAQDQASSAIYGMPRAARDMGGAVYTLPLNQIAGAVLAAVAELMR